MRGRIFVDKGKCLTCKRCVIACTLSHSESGNIYEAMFEDPPPRSRMRLTSIPGGAVPVACRQCEGAPCMVVCPSGAISRENSADPVILDNDLCVGCRSCVVVCPYGVPEMSHDRSSVIKCDLCIHRLEEEMEPACVDACPTGCLTFVLEAGEADEKNPDKPYWLTNPCVEE